jgi:hypothetical protein
LSIAEPELNVSVLHQDIYFAVSKNEVESCAEKLFISREKVKAQKFNNRKYAYIFHSKNCLSTPVEVFDFDRVLFENKS